MSRVGEMIVSDGASLSVKLLRRGRDSEWKETVGGSGEDVVVESAGGERRQVGGAAAVVVEAR